MAIDLNSIAQFFPYLLLGWTLIMLLHLLVREHFWKAKPYVLGRLFIGIVWVLISLLIASRILAVLGALLMVVSLVQKKKWKQGSHAFDWDTMKKIDKVIWISHVVVIFVFAASFLGYTFLA